MLAELGLEQAELSVLLTNDREIQALNREHRAKDRPTDVLAFALEEGEHAALRAGNGVRVLGDVVISLDTAARQARGRKRELLLEVRLLLAHGLLHLLGYDHAGAKEKREMSAMTRRLQRAGAGVTANRPKKADGRGSREPRHSAGMALNPGERSGRARARHAK